MNILNNDNNYINISTIYNIDNQLL